MKPLCFVLMPFGIKTDGNKKEIDFDKVYTDLIRPAIVNANLQPIRADEERTGGFIHKPMYERLMFCDFAVADLSFANANVFYELGIRHALKPYTTISIYDVSTKLPFDVAPLRTFPYTFEDGQIKDLAAKIIALTNLIKTNIDAENAENDSPIGQFIEGYKFPDLKDLAADASSFAQAVWDVNTIKHTLIDIEKEWKALEKTKKDATDAEIITIKKSQNQLVESVNEIKKEQATILKYNYDLLYGILEAYKAMGAFTEITKMLQPLVAGPFKNIIYIKQQLALAYNKTKIPGDKDNAQEILTGIIEQYGPDPETNGLLGAVLKGKMDENKADEDLVNEYCGQAIDAYLQGFEADPRDYYPGVNALTLLFFMEKQNERFEKYYPLVSFAVERNLQLKAKDYWVQATALELAALKQDEQKCKRYLAAAITCLPDNWMKQTTYNNLKKIYDKLVIDKNESDWNWLSSILERLKVWPPN